VPCLGIGSDNELYNINADHMAAACRRISRGRSADLISPMLPACSMGKKSSRPSTCEEVERLVQCHVVSGGMVLKLEAAKRAIEGGVREVRIVGGTSSEGVAARVACHWCN